jgi:hypothetical protein
MFDRVTLLLGGGRLIYDGGTAGLTDYLAKRGYQCPLNYNPSDYVMSIMQETSSQKLDQLAAQWDDADAAAAAAIMPAPADLEAGSKPTAAMPLVDDNEIERGGACARSAGR